MVLTRAVLTVFREVSVTTMGFTISANTVTSGALQRPVLAVPGLVSCITTTEIFPGTTTVSEVDFLSVVSRIRRFIYLSWFISFAFKCMGLSPLGFCLERPSCDKERRFLENADNIFLLKLYHRVFKAVSYIGFKDGKISISFFVDFEMVKV